MSASRTARRALLALLVAGALALWLWREGEPERVEKTLKALAVSLGEHAGEDPAGRSARLARELAELVSEDVRVEIPELYAGSGRERALAAASSLGREARPVLHVEHVEVTLADASHAEARFDVVVSDSRAVDLHALERPGHASLVKSNERWRVAALVVERQTRPEPEPRP